MEQAEIGRVLGFHAINEVEGECGISRGRRKEGVVVRCADGEKRTRGNLVLRAEALLDLDGRQRLEGSAVAQAVFLSLDFLLVGKGNLRDASGLDDGALQALAAKFDERILAVRVIELRVLGVRLDLARIRAENRVIHARNPTRVDLPAISVHDLDEVVRTVQRVRDVRRHRDKVRVGEVSGLAGGVRGLLDEGFVPSVGLDHLPELDLRHERALEDDAGVLKV